MEDLVNVHVPGLARSAILNALMIIEAVRQVRRQKGVHGF
jgi:hypothetical protein